MLAGDSSWMCVKKLTWESWLGIVDGISARSNESCDASSSTLIVSSITIHVPVAIAVDGGSFHIVAGDTLSRFGFVRHF